MRALYIALVLFIAGTIVTLALLRYRRQEDCLITGKELQAAIARYEGKAVAHPADPLDTCCAKAYAEKVTIVHPYYKNAATLRRLLDTYWSAPKDIQASFLLLIVDDASPENPAEEVVASHIADRYGNDGDPPVETRVVTLEEDIGFNVAGARNTGVEAAPTEVVVYGDIDFAVDPGDMAALLKPAADLREDPYKVYCVRHEKNWYTTMWMVSKTAFKVLGGYDEDYSGKYGGEEQDFEERAFRSSLVSTAYHPDYVVTEEGLAKNRAEDHCSSCQDLHEEGSKERVKDVKAARAFWEAKQRLGPNRDVGKIVRLPWHSRTFSVAQ